MKYAFEDRGKLRKKDKAIKMCNKLYEYLRDNLNHSAKNGEIKLKVYNILNKLTVSQEPDWEP